VSPVFSCITSTPWPVGRAGYASYPMSVAVPSPDGMVTASACRRRGSPGFTVVGSVVAVEGGVAYATFGCGDGGLGVGTLVAAVPLPSGRG